MRWTVQINAVYTVFVVCNHFIQVVHSWIENITVQRKTMRCLLHKRWDCTTETEKVDFLVSVVKLQNLADLLDHLEVLVLHHAKVVQ